MRAKLTHLLLLLLACSCARVPDPTPPSVSEQYHALQDSLKGALPGASVHRLSSFLDANAQYSVADTVRREIERIKSVVPDNYREARELARQGDFDHAERLLSDLAINLPDTRDGRSAAKHLAFDFYYGKAQWLLTQQRFAEAERTARVLLETSLTPAQTDQVQAMLDNLGYVDAATSLAERSQAESACRHLSVMLAQMYVEEGRYPQHFTLKSLDQWRGHDDGFIRRGLSAIENYHASDRGFSFVGVSRDGRHRLRVEDGRILDD